RGVADARGAGRGHTDRAVALAVTARYGAARLDARTRAQRRGRAAVMAAPARHARRVRMETRGAAEAAPAGRRPAAKIAGDADRAPHPRPVFGLCAADPRFATAQANRRAARCRRARLLHPRGARSVPARASWRAAGKCRAAADRDRRGVVRGVERPARTARLLVAALPADRALVRRA